MRDMIKVNIANVAKRRGIKTAYQLQKALDVPPSQAAKLWKGEIKMIGLDTLDRLCRALKCKPDKIFVYEPEVEDVDGQD